VNYSSERTSPSDDYIAYGQFSTFLALWFGGVMGLPSEEFLAQYIWLLVRSLWSKISGVQRRHLIGVMGAT